MREHLATLPSESKALRQPFCALDEASYHLDSVSEPCSVHLDVCFNGTVDEDRLRHAVRVALSRHPRALARVTIRRRPRAGDEWQITPAPDVDPLDVVVRPDDDALQAGRAGLPAESRGAAVDVATIRRRWAARKACQAYHHGFIQGLANDPKAVVLTIVDDHASSRTAAVTAA